MRIDYRTAVGVLRMMAERAMVDSIASFGISEADWKLVTGPKPWIGLDRARVCRVLDSLIFGSMDLAGLPRFRVPAEYVSAVLVTFVSPNNLMLACAWREQSPSADDLSRIDGVGAEPVRAHQLFALCTRLHSQNGIEKSSAQAAFEKHVGAAIDHARVAGAPASPAPTSK